jgi:hypothetical protein
MARKKCDFDDQDMNGGGNSPNNTGWKRSTEGLKNIAKTGSLYKQEMEDNTKQGGKFPKQDRPFIATNEPPDGK